MANPPSGGGEKTEKPTAKRLSEAAKNGDLLQSRDLATALVVMAGVAWLAITGPSIFDSMAHMLTQGLRFDHEDVADFSPSARFYTLLGVVAVPVGGVLLATVLAAVAGPALLGSLGFRPNAFKVKPSKLNPASGLKRIFGLQGLIELAKSIAKVALLGSIGFWLVWDRLTAIVAMGRMGLEPALAEVGSIFILACVAMAGALFVIAGIDVPSQIMQRNKRLYMTKQEVRDEHKEQEGSPEMKGQIRRRQHEMMNNSTRKAVAEASVIITNPTHFAVALRYHPGKDAAPVVVARGRGDVALSIRELARAADVPILEYPQLARAIYFTARAGRVIPEELFVAVATVLAFVFQLERAVAEGLSKPLVDVPPSHRFDPEGRRQN